MKNWKYIEGAKTGNSLGTDIYQHKLDPNQYMVVDWDKQTVTIIVNGHVRDVIKNVNNLAYVLHLYKKVNVMNTKSGNDTPWEYAHRKPKVINEDKTGAEEFFKKLSDDVKEREKKDDADIEKVGNYTRHSDYNSALRSLDFWEKAQREAAKSNRRATPVRDTLGIYKIDKTYYVMTEGEASAKGWKNYEVHNKKVGNREIYVNQSEQTKAVVYEDGTIMLWDKNGNNYKTIKAGSLEEARKKLNSDYKKVGNTKTGNYSKEELLKYAKQYGDKELIDHIMSGKMTQAELGARTRWFQYQWDGRDINGKIVDKEKAGNKTGNEKSDDKFAYVMREFDEGKLKTPDGKVVTDPAQAKAIAYSESKKTENGLARARKAMNAWNSDRKIEPVGKYREFIDNLKNAIELGVAGVLYNSLDEQTVKEWVEKAKKEGYGSHISGVQGKKVILK